MKVALFFVQLWVNNFFRSQQKEWFTRIDGVIYSGSCERKCDLFMSQLEVTFSPLKGSRFTILKRSRSQNCQADISRCRHESLVPCRQEEVGTSKSFLALDRWAWILDVFGRLAWSFLHPKTERVRGLKIRKWLEDDSFPFWNGPFLGGEMMFFFLVGG